MNRRRLAWLTVVALAAGFVAVLGSSRMAERSADAAVSEKHTICHRTAATGNPYRRITVSINAIYNGQSGSFKTAKHPIHDDYPFKTYDTNADGILSGAELTAVFADHPYDNTFFGFPNVTTGGNPVTVQSVKLVTIVGTNPLRTTDNVFRASSSYPASQKKWGDIIKPYKPGWDSQNWGAEGQAIFDNVGQGAGLCVRMSALQFLTNECTGAANEVACLNAAIDDLKEQDSVEDAGLEASLGASGFDALKNKTLAQITTSVNAANPQATTDVSPCSVTSTGANSWSAVFKGSAFTNDGSLFTFFQYGANAQLPDPEAVAANTWNLANISQTPTNNANMNTVSKTGVSKFDSGSSLVPVALNSVPVALSGAVYVRTVVVSEVPDPDLNNSYIATWYYGETRLCDVNAAPVSRTLNVTRDGAGIGSVTDGAGLSCVVGTGACNSGTFNNNTVVTLTVSPAAGSSFVGWNVAGGTSSCSNASLSCAITLSSNATVTVTFDLLAGSRSLVVTRDGNGTGSVTDSGTLSCNAGTGACDSENYSDNTVVTLTATPAAGSTFGGWNVVGGTSSCSNASLSCAVTLSSNAVVTATFNLRTLVVTRDGNGTGSVTDGGTLSCSDGTGACGSETYNNNTVVTLTATPAAGSTFVGWNVVGGTSACSNSSLTCAVTLNANSTVTATFSLQAVFIPPTTAAPSTSSPSTSSPTTVGPPAKANDSNKDPRVPDEKPLNEKVEVDLGPSNPGGGGSVQIAPTNGGPSLELLGASIDDPNYDVKVVSSGVEYNKPETWVKEGFGDECWKIEPGSSSYLLPGTPTPPSGRSGGSYSAVKVKAGSLTSDDPNFQVNTLFLSPAGGSMVWPDSNKDGVYNPGGRTGDKDISHVILCVRYGAPSAPTTAAPTTGAPTTAAPSTAGPTTSFAVPTTTFTTTSTPSEAPRIELLVEPRVPVAPTTAGPGLAKLSIIVSSGATQGTIELEINLKKFLLVGGNIPLPELPTTGSSSSGLLQFALAVLALGVCITTARRRLRRPV